MIQEIIETADKNFFKRVFSITIPVTMQNLLSSSRNLVDTVMIGTLGVVQVAAVGAAGKPFFVLLIVLFGLTNGSGILISQYWGKKDSDGVAKNVLLTLALSLVVSITLSFLIKIYSTQIIGFTSTDPQVIFYGSEYLRIISNNLILQSIILSLNIGLRSTGQVKKCTFVSLIGVILNVLLNYMFIFGNFGFQAMGLKGAGYGTLISCFVEAFVILAMSVFFNKSFTLSLKKFKDQIEMIDIKRLLKVSIPLALNSFAWAGGTYIYFIIYGRIGSHELAIMTMLEPLQSLMISFFTGLATGSGILLGHSLGQENFDVVWKEAKVIVVIGLIMGVIIFTIMFFSRDLYLGFFTSLPIDTILMAKDVYGFLLIRILFMSVNIVVIVGILRSGGDTKFVLFTDISCQWLVGIPLGFLAAFVWKLPLTWVVIFIISEEFVKVFLSTGRMKGKKWIRNLVS